MDNSKQIQSYICKDLHISNRISFERETPNLVKGATNKRRSEEPFARAHLGLDGGRGDDARVGADGLRHGSTTACHLTLGSPAKK